MATGLGKGKLNKVMISRHLDNSLENSVPILDIFDQEVLIKCRIV